MIQSPRDEGVESLGFDVGASEELREHKGGGFARNVVTPQEEAPDGQDAVHRGGRGGGSVEAREIEWNFDDDGEPKEKNVASLPRKGRFFLLFLRWGKRD